jgi:hypothetical protein
MSNKTEGTMSKLREHFNEMQKLAERYLHPGGYVSRDGRRFVDPDQAARVFASDVIYMLDGPEEREALRLHDEEITLLRAELNGFKRASQR